MWLQASRGCKGGISATSVVWELAQYLSPKIPFLGHKPLPGPSPSQRSLCLAASLALPISAAGSPASWTLRHPFPVTFLSTSGVPVSGAGAGPSCRRTHLAVPAARSRHALHPSAHLAASGAARVTLAFLEVTGGDSRERFCLSEGQQAARLFPLSQGSTPTSAVPQSQASPGSTTLLPHMGTLYIVSRAGLFSRHCPSPAARKRWNSFMLQLLKTFTPFASLQGEGQGCCHHGLRFGLCCSSCPQKVSVTWVAAPHGPQELPPPPLDTSPALRCHTDGHRAHPVGPGLWCHRIGPRPRTEGREPYSDLFCITQAATVQRQPRGLSYAMPRLRPSSRATMTAKVSSVAVLWYCRGQGPASARVTAVPRHLPAGSAGRGGSCTRSPGTRLLRAPPRPCQGLRSHPEEPPLPGAPGSTSPMGTGGYGDGQTDSSVYRTKATPPAWFLTHAFLAEDAPT